MDRQTNSQRDMTNLWGNFCYGTQKKCSTAHHYRYSYYSELAAIIKDNFKQKIAAKIRSKFVLKYTYCCNKN